MVLRKLGSRYVSGRECSLGGGQCPQEVSEGRYGGWWHDDVGVPLALVSGVSQRTSPDRPVLGGGRRGYDDASLSSWRNGLLCEGGASAVSSVSALRLLVHTAEAPAV